ncbi:hypothetical protein OAF56_02535 [Pirellulaceae bacterium]|nr:hypothetical protein [Pirellulaceae bacterium]
MLPVQIAQKLILFAVVVSLGGKLANANISFVVEFESEAKAAIDQYQTAQAIQNPQERLAAFRRTELAFASLLDMKASQTAELYVNWGNAALQAENLGNAVFAYRRALELDANHQQAAKNLDFIRAALPEWARPSEVTSPMIGQLLFWQTAYSAFQIYLFTSIMFLIGCGLIAISIRYRISILRNIAVLPILVWGILLICEFSRTSSSNEDAAVFMADETVARTADSINATAAFATSIPLGTEATVIESRAEWIKVEFGKAKNGWVPRSAIRLLGE